MPTEDDFFADADPQAIAGREHDVERNGAGPPAARTGTAARRTVSSLREALTGTDGPSVPVAERADRSSAPTGAWELEDEEGTAVVGPPRPPRPIRREEVHHRPPGPLQRSWAWFTDELLVSAGERAERAEDARLNRLEGPSRSNLVPFVGPRGGGGKTTHARTTGGILAGANCGSVVLLDADQHYGTRRGPRARAAAIVEDDHRPAGRLRRRHGAAAAAEAAALPIALRRRRPAAAGGARADARRCCAWPRTSSSTSARCGSCRASR